VAQHPANAAWGPEPLLERAAGRHENPDEPLAFCSELGALALLGL